MNSSIIQCTIKAKCNLENNINIQWLNFDEMMSNEYFVNIEFIFIFFIEMKLPDIIKNHWNIKL